MLVRLQFSTISDKRPLVPEGPKITPPRQTPPPSPTRGNPPPPRYTLVPVLQAHAGAQEMLRQGAVACQGTNFTAKRGLKAPFVAKFGVHLGKNVPCRAWGRVWYSGGSKKKTHVARGGVWDKREKKKRPKRERGSPHAWGRGIPTRAEGVPHAKISTVSRASQTPIFDYF